MKYKKMIVVDHNELNRAVELQYSLEPHSIDVMKLFDLDYAENGSYHHILFNNETIYYNELDVEYAEKYHQVENIKLFRNRSLVLTYLQNIFHDEVNTGILLFIYW